MAQILIHAGHFMKFFCAQGCVIKIFE